MQVAPSASTYAPAPGDLASPPAPGSAYNSYTDQPQDNAGAFADNGSGGYSQPDSQYPHAAPIDSTPGEGSTFTCHFGPERVLPRHDGSTPPPAGAPQRATP